MVVGDDFLPDYPENLWKKRKNIPVIIGTTKDEYAYDGKGIWFDQTLLKIYRND